MIRIKPKSKDKKVVNPGTLKRVPMEGIVIPKMTTYWNNRKKDGDISCEKISQKKKSQGDK